MLHTVTLPSLGTVELRKIDGAGRTLSRQVARNTVVYEGLDLLGKIMAGESYQINMMYLEFQNGGTYPTATVDPSQGRSYYAALDAGVSARDYLRVLLIADPVTSSSNDSRYESNRVTYVAMSTGQNAGQGGHEFSAAAQSIVYGAALVAAPSASDLSQDLVFARLYADGVDFTAIEKEVNQEVVINWRHTFGEALLESSS